MEKFITIGGKTFELVVLQQGGVTGVYRGNGEYVRVGEPASISRHLEVHTMMENAGYPVAALLDSGTLGDKAYFIEKSLGDKSIGDNFEEDWQTNGAISEEHFRELLQVVLQYAEAQMTTHTTQGPPSELASGIFLGELCKELPGLARKIQSRFDEASERLSAFPFVLSHGDFNPRNLFAAGVIDLEHFFQAPFGFDLVTALIHIDLHPDDRSYEFYARYRYSNEQKRRYFLMLDKLAAKYQLPVISAYAADLAFLRAVWSTARMHKWPKIQKWRYDLLIQTYFS
ncbi:MAG: Uncharacterized protein G01um10148_618 [Parcubacteria group bacterium Gr01-1014_8]|nr:MAG: Uncharacterized protein G01um10148_618 [Parcubacteria group bacterium Gr01-1014_8]